MLFFFFSSFLSIPSMAQDNSLFHIWSDFAPSYNLDEKWKVSGDIGYRIVASSNTQTAYIRPGINFKPNKLLSFRVGLSNFNTWSTTDLSIIEFRTFQFLLLSWPQIGNFKFKHRFGFEQRMFNANKFMHRARYFLELKSPEINLFKTSPPIYLVGNVEFLGDVNNDIFGRLIDHNRFTIGVGCPINDQFSIEVEYKIFNVMDLIQDSFVKEIEVLRLEVYYLFNKF